MVSEIGNIVVDQISMLPFIDKYAGNVRVLSYKDKTGTLVKFPVDCRATLDECKKGKRYLDLCPDNDKKSVLYLEDTGLRLIRREGDVIYWAVNYDLICWLNLPKLGFNDCSFSSIAIMQILKKFSVTPFNSGNYNKISINLNGQRTKQTNPFLKYSYDETVNQFLLYPHDYFVLSLEVLFAINTRCITIVPLGPEVECLIK